MRFQRLSFIFTGLTLLVLMSCQPGAPVVSLIGQVTGFSLNETVQNVKSKSSNKIFYISGKCNPAITDIEISFDNGATFVSLGNYAEGSYIKNCSSTGDFSYKINPQSKTEFSIPANSSFKDFKIRGFSDFGITSALNLRRMVSSDFQVTAGSARITSGSMVLQGRLVSSIETSTGTPFRFTGSIRIK